jgi:oligosaccharide repeat unit polymerase
MSILTLERRAGPPWWMAPYALSLALMVPLLTAAWVAPIEYHWELGRMAKFMTFDYYVLGVAGVFCFAAGAFLTTHSRPSTSSLTAAEADCSPAICRLLKIATWCLFGVTVAAYAIWFMPVARDPSILVDVFMGRWYERNIRDTIGTIPGVTTLVQAQVPYVTLLVLRWLYVPNARPSQLEKVALLGVVFLALVRNFVWSERIAVVELVVPLAILFLRKPRYPLLTALAPVFGVVALLVFFSIFEYFRSWSAYYQTRYDSFFVFILARLSGYYVTALDNGAGMVHDFGGLAGPLNTLDWLWRFPLEIGQTFLSKALGFDIQRYDEWLYWNASPEFNNPSGIYMPLVDYGAAGGLVFWFLFGLLTGLIYRGFVRGSFGGLLIYPSWFIGLMEMPRIMYLCEARYFPVIVICAALIFVVWTVAGQEARAVPNRRLT